MVKQNGFWLVHFMCIWSSFCCPLFIFVFYCFRRPRRPFVVNIYFSQLIVVSIEQLSCPPPLGPKCLKRSLKLWRGYNLPSVCYCHSRIWMKNFGPARRKAIKAFKYLHTQPEKSKQAGAQSSSCMQINAKQLEGLESLRIFLAFGGECVCKDFDFKFCQLTTWRILDRFAKCWMWAALAALFVCLCERLGWKVIVGVAQICSSPLRILPYGCVLRLSHK